MQDLLNVVLPVFLVIGTGYILTWRGFIQDSHIDGLMRYSQGIAIPCLLFMAIATLDLRQSFDLRLWLAFYAGALTGFSAGLLGARFLFKRSWENSVAVAFIGLFSNSLLLGLPITERAYGTDALASNFAIIAIHAPFCYLIGITAMELVRARGQSTLHIAKTVSKAMFRNALVVGIGLGFVVNLTGLTMPEFLVTAINLIKQSALPAALFGLGGILLRYRPEGDGKLIAYMVAISLVLHPVITFGLSAVLDLSLSAQRSAVVTAAMAPGINAYLFANMYDEGKRIAASSILIGTALCIVTAWIWLQILP